MKTPASTSRAAHLLGLALSLCLLSLSSRAETQPVEVQKTETKASPIAIGAEAGTAGFGPDVIITVSKNFTVTGGYTWLNFNYDTSSSDADYTGKLKLSNVQAMVNWHPFAGTFHISAGAFLSDNKVTVTGKPKGNATYEIGGTTYTAAQIGTLSGNAELVKGAAPYVGFGWAKTPVKGGFGVFADIGVLFTSSAKASLSATGPIAGDATFQSNLRTEEKKVNDDLKPLRYYPIIKIGVLYRF
jgi:hypothetical protein